MIVDWDLATALILLRCRLSAFYKVVLASSVEKHGGWNLPRPAKKQERRNVNDRQGEALVLGGGTIRVQTLQILVSGYYAIHTVKSILAKTSVGRVFIFFSFLACCLFQLFLGMIKKEFPVVCIFDHLLYENQNCSPVLAARFLYLPL